LTGPEFIDIIKFAVFGILLHIPCRLDRLPAITDHKERMVKLKSTGIVRKVDELGRIVLPIELRRTLDIAEKDSLEIYMDGPSIVLRKYQPACIFCDDAKDVIMFHGKNICPKCIKSLQESLTQE
jgi:transcriptional pleiotropic regulator of transition state genes